MRDGNYRPALHEPFQGLDHKMFGLAVERSGRLVENQDRVVANDRAGDADPLPLAAGERETAFTDRAVVAVRHAGDELMGIGQFRRLDDLVLGGPGMAVGDVVADGSAEEHGFLQNEGNVFAEFVKLVILNVHAVDLDASGVSVVEAGDEAYDGGFPAAGRADEADQLARLDNEADVAQNWTRRVITERHVLELDFTAQRLRLQTVGAVRNDASASRIARTRSTPTDVWAIVLVIVARSCTGLKNMARYERNTVRVPTSIASANTSEVPRQSTNRCTSRPRSRRSAQAVP
jgi:hypothetical protein